MRAIDIILKKRGGASMPQQALMQDEIEFFIKDYVANKIPDYQVAAFLMAIYFNGMTASETAYLTKAMLDSGKRYDLSEFGFCVDKHSTGGVGDKVSIPLAAIVASCGLKVPMMSGRALGATGGTLDKLDSITGYKTNLTETEFKAFIKENGYAMTSQTDKVVPADKKLYALRDVTGTVESIPLITSSILSKKIAEGSDALVFDVKCGSGAFMKAESEAIELAKSLINTGTKMGKKIVALITDMSEPLGFKVGNFLEIEESVELLKGIAPSDITELTLQLASWMLFLGGKVSCKEDGYDKALNAVKSNQALECFYRNVKMQGGDLEKLKADLGKRRSPYNTVIKAKKSGYVKIDAQAVGQAGIYLGIGRNKATDTVYSDAGIVLHKKRGDFVNAGDVVMDVYGKSDRSIFEATPILQSSIFYIEKPFEPKKQILKELTEGSY